MGSSGSGRVRLGGMERKLVREDMVGVVDIYVDIDVEVD